MVFSLGSVVYAAKMMDSDPVYLNGYYASSGDSLWDYVKIYPNGKVGVYVKNLTSFDVQWYVKNVDNGKIYGQGILYSNGSVVNKRYSVPPGYYKLHLQCRYALKYCKASGVISSWR
jgi:hypothetical protein